MTLDREYLDGEIEDLKKIKEKLIELGHDTCTCNRCVEYVNTLYILADKIYDLLDMMDDILEDNIEMIRRLAHAKEGITKTTTIPLRPVGKKT